MSKKSKRVNFTDVVHDRKLPILTLDNRWHELFPEDEKTAAIRELEQRVNNLLKRQGKLVNDIKDMKQLKTSLLKDIVDNMDIESDGPGREKEKKLDKNKHYISEINEKVDTSSEELADLPYQIKLANEELVSESFNLLYWQMEDIKDEIQEVDERIANLREELKSELLLKQDMEARNTLIYAYMHDILGAKVIGLFDRELDKKE